VLGISPAEALNRLKQGDTAFLLGAAPGAGRAELEGLVRLHPSAPFYAGLNLRGANLPGPARILFEISLDSPNARVRQAAAFELFGLLFQGETLPPPVLERLQATAPELWTQTLGLIAAPEPREKALAFFFGPDSGLPAGTGAYVLEELHKRDPGLFSPPEAGALAGHLAVSRSSFAEGMSFFRPVLEEGRSLFFHYPELLNDLGRCFQYAPTGNEGIEIFLQWEHELDEGAALKPDIGLEQREALRFRLLFFAGRIARQRNQFGLGTELFTRALPFAPDARQEDACIWYILDAALQSGPEKAAALTALYMPRWNEASYFFDILDRLSQYLTVQRNWADMHALLDKMRESGREAYGPAIAKYAYITGRALSGGLYALPGANQEPAGGADSTRAGEPFFRLAVHAWGALPYYQALSALMLGESLDELPSRPYHNRQDKTRDRELMDFLQGFFEYGAAAFALPAIISWETELSIPELRSLAESLGAAERYAESIRLVSRYMERPDYMLNRIDLRLYCPRPFEKLIEQAARESGLRRELLFALVRTESAFQPGIVSRAGAVGLTQLMPATAADMADRIKNQGGPNYRENGGPDIRDPVANLHIGTVYLRYLSDRLESPFLALLAYNGGMNRVRRWRSEAPGLPEDLFLETIPYAETREYGRKVLSAALMYGYLYYDLKTGAFFSDIFKETFGPARKGG
jgi:soluble lytic murein transglycosylase